MEGPFEKRSKARALQAALQAPWQGAVVNLGMQLTRRCEGLLGILWEDLMLHAV